MIDFASLSSLVWTTAPGTLMKRRGMPRMADGEGVTIRRLTSSVNPIHNNSRLEKIKARRAHYKRTPVNLGATDRHNLFSRPPF